MKSVQGPVARSGPMVRLRPRRRNEANRQELQEARRAKPWWDSAHACHVNGRRPLCETKPIPARATSGTSALWTKGYDEFGVCKAMAKQSQFPSRDGRPARPRFYPARVPLPHWAHKQSQSGLSRQTKPIEAATRCTNKPNSPTPPTRARRRAGSRRNKANFRPSDRLDGPGVRHPMPGTPHAPRL